MKNTSLIGENPLGAVARQRIHRIISVEKSLLGERRVMINEDFRDHLHLPGAARCRHAVADINSKKQCGYARKRNRINYLTYFPIMISA